MKKTILSLALAIFLSSSVFAAPEDNFRYIDFPGTHSFDKYENGYVFKMLDGTFIYLDKYGNITNDIVGVTGTHVFYHDNEDTNKHSVIETVNTDDGYMTTYQVETIHKFYCYDDNNNLFATFLSDSYDVTEKEGFIVVASENENFLRFYATADGSLLSELPLSDYTICHTFSEDSKPDLAYLDLTDSGLFVFKNKDGLCGLSDIHGNIALEPAYKTLMLCDGEKEYFNTKIGEKTAIIDKTGNIIKEADNFYYASRLETDDTSKLCYLAQELNGEMIYFDSEFNKLDFPIPEGHSLVDILSDDLYIIRRTDDTDKYDAKCGIINSDGEFILPLGYSRIEPMGENLFKAIDLNSTAYYAGIISDYEGNIIAENIWPYDMTDIGENGWIGINKEDFKGYINTKGEVMIELPAPFKPVTSFSEGKASVCDDGIIENGWGTLSGNHFYINEKGEFIVGGDRRWYSASKFQNGLASVAYREGKGGPDAFLLIRYTGNEPSDWAKENVQTAVSSGLVPEHLQDLYRENITREEFCELAYQALNTISNKEFDEASSTFTDTENTSVSALFNAGVIDGKADEIFAPNDLLTREEAAKILNNICSLIEIEPTEIEKFEFSDNSDISDWAKPYVYNMNTLNIMNGVGENKFAPKNHYTKEQAILTLLRIVNN